MLYAFRVLLAWITNWTFENFMTCRRKNHWIFEIRKVECWESDIILNFPDVTKSLNVILSFNYIVCRFQAHTSVLQGRIFNDTISSSNQFKKNGNGNNDTHWVWYTNYVYGAKYARSTIIYLKINHLKVVTVFCQVYLHSFFLRWGNHVGLLSTVLHIRIRSEHRLGSIKISVLLFISTFLTLLLRISDSTFFFRLLHISSCLWLFDVSSYYFYRSVNF